VLDFDWRGRLVTAGLTLPCTESYGAVAMTSPLPAVPDFTSTADVPCWRIHDGEAIVAFSTRLGGVSAPPFDTLNLGRSTEDDPAAVTENRRRLLVALAVDPTRLATAGQVHGTDLRQARTPELHPACDGLWTSERGLGLAVTGADCMPIAYVASGLVAVAHSGWRGTAAGMPVRALETVTRGAGVGPERVHVYVGPSIRACCYRVGDDVARQFPAAALQRRDGAWHLDLVAAARIQLAHAGADPAHVVDLLECTACTPSRYFSHRRDAGRTGRQWAVAALQA